MVPACQQTDAVRTNQCCTILFTSIENLLFQHGTLVGFLTETCREDDESTCLFLLGQQFHILRTELRSYHEDSQFGGWQFAGVMESLDALHLVLLGIDDAQGSLITTLQKVTHDGATGFMYIIRTTDNDNRLRF